MSRSGLLSSASKRTFAGTACVDAQVDEARKPDDARLVCTLCERGLQQRAGSIIGQRVVDDDGVVRGREQLIQRLGNGRHADRTRAPLGAVP